MFKKSETTIGSAVASGGTITFSYPSNTNAGSFSAFGHKLWVDKFQTLLSSPKDITVAFGSSSIVVTYNGLTEIPVGARCNAQFNIDGADNGEVTTRLEDSTVKRSSVTTLVTIDLGAPDAIDTNGVFESYSGAAGEIPLDGALASNGVVTFDVPRNITIDSGGADTAVLTFTGTDEYGVTVVEAITLNGTTSVIGKKAFKTVTSCVSSGTIANGAFAGTGDIFGLPVFLPSTAYVLKELLDGVTATSGTIVDGDSAEATATTGDVRGTYDASSAPNGVRVFKLIAALPDAEYKGVTQFAG